MTTIWLHRINLIVPEVDKSRLNGLWTMLAPEGDSEAVTFGVPLSATGEEPATHRGVSTAATELMRIYVTDTFAADLTTAVVSIEPYTSNNWTTFLAAAGLQVISPPLEI